MSEKQISYTYKGIVVTYDEPTNLWRFELRGRDRTAPSLLKAKEFIDKVPDEKEGPTFKRQSAYYHSWSTGYDKCEITSVADARYGSQYYWILKDGRRTKEPGENLYADTEANRALIARHKEISEQISALDKQKEKLADKITKFKL